MLAPLDEQHTDDFKHHQFGTICGKDTLETGALLLRKFFVFPMDPNSSNQMEE